MMSDRGATVCTHKVTCSNAGRNLERSVRDGSVRTTRVARVSGGAPHAAAGSRPELVRAARRDDTAAGLRAGARRFAALRAPQRGAAPRDVPAHLAARRRFGAHAVGAGPQHRPGQRAAARGLSGRGGAARRGFPAGPAARGSGLRTAGAGAVVAGPGPAPRLCPRRLRGPRPQAAAARGERGPSGRRPRRPAVDGVRAPDHPGLRRSRPCGPSPGRLLALRARVPAPRRCGGLPVGGRAHGHPGRAPHVRGLRPGKAPGSGRTSRRARSASISS